MRSVRFLLVPIILAGLMLACATSNFDTTTYKTLASSKVAYDTSFKILAELQKQKQISDSDLKVAYDAGGMFYSSYLLAEAAYETYHNNQTPVNQQTTDAAIKEMAQKLATFQSKVPAKGGVGK